jgi:predicted nucleotidyltransferase
MFGLRSSDIDLIVEILRRHPDIEEAIIFGSRAIGNYKPGSDVDIALKGNLNSEISNDVSVELNERVPLPYKFDVVAYATLSHMPLIEHIDRYGKVVYKKS